MVGTKGKRARRVALSFNCQQAGNIQRPPRSRIDQADHTLLQYIAPLIGIDISFHLPVSSETGPHPSGGRRQKAADVNYVPVPLVFVIDPQKTKVRRRLRRRVPLRGRKCSTRKRSISVCSHNLTPVRLKGYHFSVTNSK